MANLYVMCGLPGSGKSTYAKELAEKENAIIVSTDSIRQEFYGNEEIQGDTEKVFKKAYIDILNSLKDNKNVIFDATNINFKNRIDIVKRYKKYADKIICVFRATPYEVCLERNSKRDRKVPEQVIRRMYEHFFVPQMYEGFDRIIVDMEIEHLNYYAWEQLQDISQDNPYHTLTVLEHCKQTLKLLKSANIYLRLAALYHDIGKLKTKQFKDCKGNDSDIAHFYNHENVGAYDILFYRDIGEKVSDRLKVSEYIQWHMLPYVTMSERKSEYYHNLLGDEFFNDMFYLNEADRNAK